MTVIPTLSRPLQPGSDSKLGMPRLASIAGVLFTAGAMMAGNAAAQIQKPGVGTENPSTQVPLDAGTSSNQPLSEQLSKSQGVITPPAGVDPGIHAPAPEPNPNTTPVIPPPAGFDPNVQPK